MITIFRIPFLICVTIAIAFNNNDEDNNLMNSTMIPEDINKTSSENINKTLYFQLIPGYPGVRSDIYEIYMEPYNFAIGTKAAVDLKTYEANGMPASDGPNGALLFEQHEDGIKVSGQLLGLRPYVSYKLVVHKKGQLTKGCVSSGELYNPYTAVYAETKNETIDPTADPLHDFSNLIDNIEVRDDGTARIEGMSNHRYFTLTSRANTGIIGRTIIITDNSTNSNLSQLPLCGILGFA